MVRSAGLVLAAALLAPAAAGAQTPVPSNFDDKVNVTIAANFMRDSIPQSLYGGRLTVANNISRNIAIVAEGAWLTGAHKQGITEFSDQDTSVLGGIRLRRIDDAKFVPYFQGTAGFSARTSDDARADSSSFAFRTDVGTDYRFSSRTAFRASLGWTFLTAPVRHQNEFGATIGLTWALGKK